ncbi:MAG TPA: TetR/AcrR family transcriptional regulator [Paludibacter sp.]
MRIKDEDKVNRIYRAAIKVVNSDGFQGSSMSKIAKEADVSAATIYLYFDNKDDMIKKLFIHLKSKMGHSYFNENNDLSPSKGTFRTIWMNHYQFIMENMEDYSFLENFSNCPLIERVEKEQKLDYCPTFELLFEKSKQGGLILNLNNDLIFSLLFSPINYLVKKYRSIGKSLSTNELIEVFDASWRAICK